jgi:hypothetical protein
MFTKKQKAKLVRDYIDSRQGRRMLAHAMTTPLFQGDPPCDSCAFKNSPDVCETRPKECRAPSGLLVSWDEKLET